MREIVNILLRTIKAHNSVKTAIFSPLQLAISKELQYTSAILECNDISFNKVGITYHFKLYIIDKLNVNNSNLNDILFDTVEIAKDIRILLGSPLFGYNEQITLGSYTISFVIDKLKDNVAGAVVDFQIVDNSTNISIENLPFDYESI